LVPAGTSTKISGLGYANDLSKFSFGEYVSGLAWHQKVPTAGDIERSSAFNGFAEVRSAIGSIGPSLLS